MTQPGTPGSQIPSSGVDDTILRVQRDLERRVSAIEATMQGTNGIVVAAGSTIRSSPFDGDLVAQTPGTVGWGMDGDTAIFNNIVVRNGIIGDDALANPVEDGVFTGSPGATFVYGTTSNAVIYSGSLAVPAGYTKALIVAFGTASGYNDTGSYGVLACKVQIGGSLGPGAGSGTTPGGTISTPAQHAVELTGLTPGGSVPVYLCGWIQISGGWNTPAGNNGALTAFALFRR